MEELLVGDFVELEDDPRLGTELNVLTHGSGAELNVLTHAFQLSEHFREKTWFGIDAQHRPTEQ